VKIIKFAKGESGKYIATNVKTIGLRNLPLKRESWTGDGW